MIVVHTIKELQDHLNEHRKSARSICLVPTMGNLHAGHLQLVSSAQQHADVVVMSLFVNPTQFSANEDLGNYPRTLQDDIDKLSSLNTDILFAPSIAEIYPLGGDNTTHVHVPGLTDILCGATRNGHFDGVTTIVCKLFNMTRADVAIFGEKDFQQLAVIRRMVRDLNIPINIIGEAIVREADGLAMSSRNGYLSKLERKTAPVLYKTLLSVKQDVLNGQNDFETIEAHAKSELAQQGFKPDYLHVFQRDQLRPAVLGDKELVILVAAFLGNTRLIDNLNVNIA